MSVCQTAVAVKMPNGVEKQSIHQNDREEKKISASCTEFKHLLKLTGGMEPAYSCTYEN